VAFLGVTNALGRANVFRYEYSPDFTERTPVPTWGRSLYFGITVQK